MKIVYNDIIPFKGYKAMNLFGVLFVRNDIKSPLNEVNITHEAIHTEQMKWMLYVPFYVWYGIEWSIRLFIEGFDGRKAYRKISFEQEAYDNEKDVEYPVKRERYGWWKYLKN